MRLNENVKIIGRNIILVPYEKEHVPKYHNWMEDEEIRRMRFLEINTDGMIQNFANSGDYHQNVQAEAVEWKDKKGGRLTGSERLSLDDEYKMQQTWRTDEDKLTFIILSKTMVDNGSTEIESMIGDVNLFLQNEDPAAELEVMIAEKTSRGSGAGTEAVSLVISYALSELPVKRFFVKITDDNIASLHLFEDKLNFQRVSHSEAFKEYTLELPLSHIDSFRGLLGSATSTQYRN